VKIVVSPILYEILRELGFDMTDFIVNELLPEDSQCPGTHRQT